MIIELPNKSEAVTVIEAAAKEWNMPVEAIAGWIVEAGAEVCRKRGMSEVMFLRRELIKNE